MLKKLNTTRLLYHTSGSIVRYLSFILFTFVVLLPVYWMTRSAFSSGTDLTRLPLVYFPQPTLKNVLTLYEQIPFGQYLLNSVIFSLSTTLLTLLVSFLAAYAFARIQFPGSNILMWTLIISMALPDIGTIVPLYRILKTLHLLDSIAGITFVMTSTLTPFTVWVLVTFIKQVPYEIEEAAILDGASLLQILWKILLPVTLPGMVTMGLINFVNAWNNLLYPLSFTTSPSAKTLSVAITEVYAGFSPWGKPWELIMAVGVVMTVPIIILVLTSQRSIIRGLTGGALK
ncbi:MAG: carbohydrate ABC transporter permease [Dehalococcoidia bacterium]|nr:carbohydrate ABC transporter permease [Dehalococcoidia bacterium]